VLLPDKLIEFSRSHPNRQRRRRFYVGPFKLAEQFSICPIFTHRAYYIQDAQTCRRFVPLGYDLAISVVLLLQIAGAKNPNFTFFP